MDRQDKFAPYRQALEAFYAVTGDTVSEPLDDIDLATIQALIAAARLMPPEIAS